VEQTAFITPSLVVTLPYTVTKDTIQPYLNLITSQHRTKPKFNDWLYTALSTVYDGISATESINDAFDIDRAKGSQLDVIGEILGRSRYLPFQPGNGFSPTLSDDNYRIALKAKVIQNGWDGTIPSIYSIWYSLFSDLTMNIVDNQNMTMSVLIDSNTQMDTVITEMIAAGYIVPKPAGVGLVIIEVTKVFENQYIVGWVTTNETMTLSQSNVMIYEKNYVGALVTTNETVTLTQ
jgi:hypothetical protein